MTAEKADKVRDLEYLLTGHKNAARELLTIIRQPEITTQAIATIDAQVAKLTAQKERLTALLADAKNLYIGHTEAVERLRSEIVAAKNEAKIEKLMELTEALAGLEEASDE